PVATASIRHCETWTEKEVSGVRERAQRGTRTAAPTVTLGRWAPRSSPLLLGVLELGSGLQRVLGGARQDDPALLLLEPAHRHGDVMLAHPEEPADAKNRVGDFPAGRHDQVGDLTDLVTGVVVDVLSDNLLLRAPADGDFAQLRLRDGDQGRPGG